jgi:hypothetical protein
LISNISFNAKYQVLFYLLKIDTFAPLKKNTIMKKLFTTLLIALGIYTAASAQTAGTTEFGVNVGLNESTVTTGDNQTNSDYRVGFNVGVSADHYFSDAWSLKVKVVYDQKDGTMVILMMELILL